MSTKIKPAGKVAILVLVVGAAIGGFRLWKGPEAFSTLIPSGESRESVVPGKVTLPSGPNSGASAASVTMPGSDPGCTDKPPVKLLGYAWNAQMGLMFANGGPQAAKGSLMCKNGVNLIWERQDDNGKMQEALTAFATELSQGKSQPTKGAHFVTIMGDGAAIFLKGLNDNLVKLGPEYKAKVIGACGYSRGEDKFMGPAKWKDDPSACRGGVVAGVIRDGDWNIAQKWLGDNNLRTNPDEKTYDPDALNWVNASDYVDAAQKYVAGYTEERPVVKNGKKTGETRKITVDSVVTWTPGDVTVAQKKGGIVSIVSTKQYDSQMPCVVIGIDKWMKQNRSTVEGMLQAIAEGGDAVKSSDQALDKASQVSAAVYHDQGSDKEYWKRYYKGTMEPDKNGVTVELGGSSVNNLADSLLTFGLAQGSANLFEATYTVFGNIVAAQYPDLLKTVPPASEVTDTSYLAALKSRNSSIGQEIKQASPKPDSGAVASQVSTKTWNIQFASGRAAFTPQALATLSRLRKDILVAGGLVVQIHGHTDNAGNADANMKLSEARAFAVKTWLEKTSPVNFPEGKLRVFAHGQTEPAAPNDTEAGRAKNRRVVIVLASTK